MMDENEELERQLLESRLERAKNESDVLLQEDEGARRSEKEQIMQLEIEALRSTVLSQEGHIETLKNEIGKNMASDQKKNFMLEKLENESEKFQQKLADLIVKYSDLKQK